MKDFEYIALIGSISLLLFGFAIGAVLAEISVERRMRSDAVSAGVAEWVLVDDSMGYKPHFKFQYIPPHIENK